jgi:hypothetical protein
MRGLLDAPVVEKPRERQRQLVSKEFDGEVYRPCAPWFKLLGNGDWLCDFR